MGPVIYIVIPCYNEEEVLHETSNRVGEKLRLLISSGMISQDSRIIFVNDGSHDGTWRIIKELNEEDKLFGGINLSRNRGHQNALLAGLMTIRDLCDAAISMDADLQDDINAIDEMIEKFCDGTDIVYGVRKGRETDSFFKKSSAEGFYKITNALGGEVVFNHADYRLMSRRALDALAEYRETNIFLRGIVPMIGYKSDVVYYDRGPRFAGESKYPLKKMLAFAWEGITSLTIRPIRLIVGTGIFIFGVSAAMLIYSLIRHFSGHTVVGWTSMMVSIWAIGGLLLISIGVIGEYIGKIYLETKDRPRYFVESFLNDKTDSI